ncbi:retrovirus-related pol polyprotein from transposon TNT 1-94 [Tanacetum coccineum]
MPLQQTFKSSMAWLRPHHTRLGGHDESRHPEQTSGADLRTIRRRQSQLTYSFKDTCDIGTQCRNSTSEIAGRSKDGSGPESVASLGDEELKNVNEALGDGSWVVAMQEELNQFIANDVWDLVPLPKNKLVIGTKWVYMNKLDENGIVSRNKARLVAQGYNQQEGIDYDETYALVARLEYIRILLAIACANDFKLYQMDVKSAFLNAFINKEVYVAQPPGFIDFEKPNYVYKLKKALYGLKQAHKAWYDRLKTILLKHEYSIAMVDNTLFTKKFKSHLIIVQIYVDDIIFGSTCQNLCDDFAKIMHYEFEMSMMGELNFFLSLQIKQKEDGIFFNQSKFIKEMLKKFGLEDSKPTKTPMSTEIKLTKDDEADSVDSTKYRGQKMLDDREMIDQGVAAALATRDVNRSTNGEDNHNSGTGVGRTERVA